MSNKARQNSILFAKIIGFIGTGLFIYGWFVNAYVKVVAKPFIYRSSDKTPYVSKVVVLGASVYRSGQLSPVLRQRMEMGIWYALSKKKTSLLLSGHAIPMGYNEPQAMSKYALNRRVPKNKLILDEHGTSTYASLFNCKHKFGYDSILIVSQNYHLFRAIFISRSMNLNAIGLVAPDAYSSKPRGKKWREIFSRIKDFTLLKVYRFFYQPE